MHKPAPDRDLRDGMKRYIDSLATSFEIASGNPQTKAKSHTVENISDSQREQGSDSETGINSKLNQRSVAPPMFPSQMGE